MATRRTAGPTVWMDEARERLKGSLMDIPGCNAAPYRKQARKATGRRSRLP